MSERKRLGVIREHRWLDADMQAKALKADGYTNLLSLDGGKHTPVTRNELIHLCRPEMPTEIGVVHTFFLANTRGKDAVGAREDLGEVIAKLEARAGIVRDVHLQLTTENKAHHEAILARAREMIGKDRQGAKSAANARRGGQEAEFSERAWLEAELIWRNKSKYPSWPACERAYRELDKKHGHKRPFTIWRANLEWGPRNVTD